MRFVIQKTIVKKNLFDSLLPLIWCIWEFNIPFPSQFWESSVFLEGAVDSRIHTNPAELSLSCDKVQSSSRERWIPGSIQTQQSCPSVLRKFSLPQGCSGFQGPCWPSRAVSQFWESSAKPVKLFLSFYHFIFLERNSRISAYLLVSSSCLSPEPMLNSIQKLSLLRKLYVEISWTPC